MMTKLFNILDPMSTKKYDAEQLAKYYYLVRKNDVVDKALHDYAFELFLAAKKEVEYKYEAYVDVYLNYDIIYVQIVPDGTPYMEIDKHEIFEFPYNAATFEL